MEQLTFTEEEVGNVRGFVNFVMENAEFSMTTRQSFEYTSLYTKAVKTIKKMEEHIFELKQVIEPPKKELKREIAKSKGE